MINPTAILILIYSESFPNHLNDGNIYSEWFRFVLGGTHYSFFHVFTNLHINISTSQIEEEKTIVSFNWFLKVI